MFIYLYIFIAVVIMQISARVDLNWGINYSTDLHSKLSSGPPHYKLI